VKSEQLQPKFGGMGKAPLWQIDDSIITGDLQAVQDSPTHVSIMPRVIGKRWISGIHTIGVYENGMDI